MSEIRKALANLKKNDDLFFLIPPGSKIMVPLREDDHSLYLLEALKRYRLYAKKDFEIFPCVFLFSSKDTPLGEYPSFSHLEVEQEEEARKRAKKKYSSYCNKLKRVAMGKEAEGNGCNLILLPTCFEEAFALFRKSLLEEGQIKTCAFVSPAPSSEAKFIRPFLSLEEESIKKGEEETLGEGKILFESLPYSQKEKEAIKKALFYNGKVALPSLSLTPTLELLPSACFRFEKEKVCVYEGGREIASFEVKSLDAHRLEISHLVFLKESQATNILNSYYLLLLEKKKPPLHIFLEKPFPSNLEGYGNQGDKEYKKIWRKEDILGTK